MEIRDKSFDKALLGEAEGPQDERQCVDSVRGEFVEP
jgi:hypothetical protein